MSTAVLDKAVENVTVHKGTAVQAKHEVVRTISFSAAVYFIDLVNFYYGINVEK